MLTKIELVKFLVVLNQLPLNLISKSPSTKLTGRFLWSTATIEAKAKVPRN